MLHGFGHEAERAERCHQKGVSDAVLQENVSDEIGGSPALHETFVAVTPAQEKNA
jgi:thiosulfate reductase/polysulfide reductase chain A